MEKGLGRNLAPELSEMLGATVCTVLIASCPEGSHQCCSRESKDDSVFLRIN